MLKDSTVTATIAVKNAAEAKQFYGQTLGLELLNEEPILVYKSGDNLLYVYESPTGGSGQASCATWNVDNLEELVKELQGKGVKFEHYDFPGSEWEGDINVMGEGKAAWFKDPSGNTLALVSM